MYGTSNPIEESITSSIPHHTIFRSDVQRAPKDPHRKRNRNLSEGWHPSARQLSHRHRIARGYGRSGRNSAQLWRAYDQFKRFRSQFEEFKFDKWIWWCSGYILSRLQTEDWKQRETIQGNGRALGGG